MLEEEVARETTEAEGLHEEINRLNRQLGEHEEKVKTLTGQQEQIL